MVLEIERCKECKGLGWHWNGCTLAQTFYTSHKPIIHGYSEKNGYSKKGK